MKQTNLFFGHSDLKFSFRVFLSFCLSFCQLEPGVVAYESVAYKKKHVSNQLLLVQSQQ